ncbi:phosphatidylinositol transfer protein [Ancylostoma ceylanicum]|uniref:Phosphatidylinositol transfer protein n=1 Tax=Ancylostoma ceylanicum TaxID=53326 RepID=A0A0D6LEW4_9BILA|nr:phosphatidylinositol transfer protein [Ancylostoma ceylanicum]
MMKKSRLDSHGKDSGVVILSNKPYKDGPGGSGQYTFKIYHIGSKIPACRVCFTFVRNYGEFLLYRMYESESMDHSRNQSGFAAYFQRVRLKPTKKHGMLIHIRKQGAISKKTMGRLRRLDILLADLDYFMRIAMKMTCSYEWGTLSTLS